MCSSNSLLPQITRITMKTCLYMSMCNVLLGSEFRNQTYAIETYFSRSKSRKPKLMYIVLAGQSIVCFLWGGGRNLVVMHGLASLSWKWAPFLKETLLKNIEDTMINRSKLSASKGTLRPEMLLCLFLVFRLYFLRKLHVRHMSRSSRIELSKVEDPNLGLTRSCSHRNFPRRSCDKIWHFIATLRSFARSPESVAKCRAVVKCCKVSQSDKTLYDTSWREPLFQQKTLGTTWIMSLKVHQRTNIAWIILVASWSADSEPLLRSSSRFLRTPFLPLQNCSEHNVTS